MDTGTQEYRHIVRILGNDIPGEKKVLVGLTQIKGIGYNFATAMLDTLGINQNMNIGDMTESNVQDIERVISDPAAAGFPRWFLNRQKDIETGLDKHLLTSDIPFTLRNDIERERITGSWRGYRHLSGLKVRGQRTRTSGPKRRCSRSSKGRRSCGTGQEGRWRRSGRAYGRSGTGRDGNTSGRWRRRLKGIVVLMGDPKYPRRVWRKPKRPLNYDLKMDELNTLGTFGLRTKRELWKAHTELSRVRHQARSLLALRAEDRAKKEPILMRSLVKIGLVSSDSTLDDVLNLKVNDLAGKTIPDNSD